MQPKIVNLWHCGRLQGSHCWHIDKVINCSQEYFDRYVTTIKLEKGDVLIFSQRLIHGVVPDSKNEKSRESVVVKYHQGWTAIPGAIIWNT